MIEIRGSDKKCARSRTKGTTSVIGCDVQHLLFFFVVTGPILMVQYAMPNTTNQKAFIIYIEWCDENNNGHLWQKLQRHFDKTKRN